ncbi:uncharacterized protein LOC143857088 [Tasmannia lanceolata]|uniref:uncharacterized protein LOC143853985 n=1 Tax=Tasmannia lanceolata TaxID=3420 RepID=UPI0040632AEB
MLKFNTELAQFTSIDVQIAFAALKHTTTDQNLKLHLTLKPPRDLQELESKINKFIRAEEACVQERSRAGPKEDQVISFSSKDFNGLQVPHDDALVIRLIIANFDIGKILVDTGSSVNMLHLGTFEEMKLGEGRLGPAEYSIYRFSGASVQRHHRTSGPERPKSSSFNPSPQNEVTHSDRDRRSPRVADDSTPVLRSELERKQHSCQKFHDRERRPPRACPQGQREPIEELDSIPISEDQPEREVRIGSLLKGTLRDQMINFLRAHKDVFAWSASDMPDIPAQMTVHRLNVNSTLKPVQQKKRNFVAERQTHIKAELEKLLQAGFVREIRYPEWLSNVVMVKKANGGWRACVDFTDLNQACPKDPYPLPRIDQLIDATSGHELLTFLDAFSGYNQIKMHEPDIPKTVFSTDQGVYCYTVMPFGLKNTGATYQRLMNKLFQRQIGRKVEEYVYDMLVKSLESHKHISDLQETLTLCGEPG